jgi:ketosteroid isomerase-like protein
VTSPPRSNVELVQAAVAAYNWNDMEGLGALCTEDVTVIPFEGWPDDPIYCGREGIIRLVSGSGRSTSSATA